MNHSTSIDADLILLHAEQLVTVAPADRPAPGIIADGAIIVRADRIAWVGRSSDLPKLPRDCPVLDLRGSTVIPGLVDSHTHLVYAGNRVNEFGQRIAGSTYAEIAQRGGGINSTVRAVRAASNDELCRQTAKRLQRCLAGGVTTVEVKSGYGLNCADELRCLEVIADLNRRGPVELVPTFLGAHAVPREFAADRAGYVRLVIDEMLPAVARSGLASFCDVFCERGAFSLAQSREILTAAKKVGLGLKIHADELSCLGGAELAASLGAVSADHLLCVSSAGIDALADSGTVATLLPGTALFLGLEFAPARKILDNGARVALATDSNPGTCPTENLLLMGALACTRMGMQPAESLAAMTLHGAAALGLEKTIGSLEVGKQADFVVCSVPRYEHLYYEFGANHVRQVFKRGRLVFDADAGHSP
jgi:imidazolonepropionase